MKLRNVFKAGGVAALGAVMAVATGSAAQAEYPEKPIKLYVGFSAGGGTDTSARGFASYVHEVPEMNGMPMIVVNKPGGSGMQAAKIVADSKPDGYTLYIINNGTFTTGELAQKNPPVRPREDMVPLGCMSRLVSSLAVHQNSPFKSAKELLDHYKKTGETLRWSNSGATSMHTLVGHKFLEEAGIKNQPIPFKGGSRARNALVAEKVDAWFNGLHMRAGFESEIRVLGVPIHERDPVNKDVPTFKEQGVPDLDVSGPMCLWGPKGLSDEVKTKVEAAALGVAGMKGFARFMKKSALAAIPLDAKGQMANMNSLHEQLGPVVAKVMK